MRSETQPIIADFDISKDVTQTHKTSLSRSPGTAEYMAPELLGAEPTEATAASDMWSFGIVIMKVSTLTGVVCVSCVLCVVSVWKMSVSVVCVFVCRVV